MTVIWVETTPEIYRAVYAKHGQDMSVFSCWTSPDTDSQTTEWGFKRADYATIKSESRNGDWHYFIACPVNNSAKGSA